MTLYIKKHITRAYVKENLETIFLFGDNMQRTGFGGQAREMRGEPNALGVPTKWSPYTADPAYFSDSDFTKVRKYIDFPFDVAIAWLTTGGSVCIPTDGFGTGLAKLEQKAPSIKEYIDFYIQQVYAAAPTKKEIE